jgi:hypothetical protein
MARGKLSREKWYVFQEAGIGDFYYAERIVDGEYEQVYLSAHCLACAKADVLAKHGGRVDLRGWHKQGACGAFMRAMQIAVDQEEEDEPAD